MKEKEGRKEGRERKKEKDLHLSGVVAIPVIPALRMLRPENQEFKISLGYILRLCLETTTKTKQKQEQKHSWCQWLTPVILTTQEAEIRRIMV
jgi:hypothetical protein